MLLHAPDDSLQRLRVARQIIFDLGNALLDIPGAAAAVVERGTEWGRNQSAS